MIRAIGVCRKPKLHCPKTLNLVLDMYKLKRTVRTMNETNLYPECTMYLDLRCKKSRCCFMPEGCLEDAILVVVQVGGFSDSPRSVRCHGNGAQYLNSR